MQNSNVLQVLEEAARKAGKLVFDSFETKHHESFKDNSGNFESLVTDVDIKSQKLIKDTLLSSSEILEIKQNEIGFIGEEDLTTNGRHLFIIDPIDGTTNFAFGIPYVCISIAYIQNGELVAGVIYNPLENILYKAEKTKGAFKVYKNHEVKLKILPQELKNTILAAHYNSAFLDKEFGVYQKLMTQIAGIRTMGAVVLDLCMFSENKFHGVINGGSYIWDLAAAGLIIEEAGVTLLDWQGNRLEFDPKNPKKQYTIVAAHPNNASTFVELLKNA